MTVRIATTSAPNQAIIKVEGWIESQVADALVRMIHELGGPIALNLTEVQSADRATEAQLQELVELGVKVRSTSPFVALLLESEPRRSNETMRIRPYAID